MGLPLLLAAAALGALPQDSAEPGFADVSEASGVLLFDSGGGLSVQMGSGTAWFDFDADGDDDLFAAQAAGANRLFRNDGGEFADVTDGAGIETLGPRDPLGASPADFDQDGLPDVYVTTTGPNMLLQNQGGGRFRDVAAARGVSGGKVFSTAASWADFDGDGDLDLYVGNYVKTASFPYHVGEPNHLFINPGKPSGASFIERADELGVSDEGVFGPSLPGFPQYVSPEGEPTAGLTLSVGTLDYDEDGDPDLQIGNDFGPWVLPNALFRNTTAAGELAFEDVTKATGFDQKPHYDMGIDAADFDHDGDWDFYCSSLGDNVFLRNDGGTFTEVAAELGPVVGTDPDTGKLLTSWATVWQDFDHDTFEDLFIVNGHIPTDLMLDNEQRVPNQLWLNQGGTGFALMEGSGLGDEGAGRGAAASDVDGDGRLDLYTTNNRQVPDCLPEDASRLWHNELAPPERGWLALRLAGRLSNREGIGARVDALVGGTVLKRQVLADTIYLSGSSREVHFGLGLAERVERLTVHWPSGVSQDLLALEKDQRLELVEPAATVTSIDPPKAAGKSSKLRAQLTNHGDLPLAATVSFFAVDASGEWVPLGGQDVVLAPGPGNASVKAGLPPGSTGLIVRVEADGAQDEESLALDAE